MERTAKSNRRLIVAAIVLGLTVSWPFHHLWAQSQEDPRPERIEALLDAYLALDQFSGAVLVAEGERVLFRGAFGHSDRELRVPAAPEHRFVIGSLTKAFTAVLVLQEVAGGRIALDAPVVRHWPDFPDPSDGHITVRHLLTHRSGLRHWGAVDDFLVSTARLRHDREELVALYASRGLRFSPGTDEAYSSPGYLALGVLLEKVTGMSYRALLAERIFEPLGMTSSSLDDGVTILPGRARSYRYSFLDAEYQNAEYRDPSTTYSTGGVLSTVDDLLHWSQGLSTDLLLPDSLRGLLFDPVQGEAAYGWRASDLGEGIQAFWHTGLETGFRSYVVRVPARGWTVVLLANLRDAPVSEIARRIGTVLQGGEVELPKRSLMKAVLAAAAAEGGDSAAARFRAILRSPGDYDTDETQALIAAIELRSDDACDRSAPVYEAWLEEYPESRYRSIGLVGAADCRLRLGQRRAALAHVEELEAIAPEHDELEELRRRLETTPSGTQEPGPVEEVLALWNDADVVALGERHGGRLDSDFRLALVRHPDFARTVDVIVVEFANAHRQDTLDRFIAGDNVPRSELVRVWRDTGYEAWDSPIYEAFLKAVRDVNATLPTSQRIRVLAGDVPTDWETMSSGRELLQFADRGDFPTHIVDCRILARNLKGLLVYGSGHVIHGEATSFVSALDRKYPGRIRALTALQERAMNRLRTSLDLGDEPGLIEPEGTFAEDLGATEAIGIGGTDQSLTLGEAVDGILYHGAAKDEVVPPDPGTADDPEYQRLRARMDTLRREYRAIVEREGFGGMQRYDDYTCSESR